jgi:hypothetical protein
MKKKSLLETNPYLKSPKIRAKNLVTSACSSTSIETTITFTVGERAKLEELADRVESIIKQAIQIKKSA